MFGTNSNSIFGSTGASGGLFGQAQQPKQSLFGTAQPTQPATGGLFGGQSTSTSLFSQNTAQPQQQSGGIFGSQPAVVVGTTVKFVPVTSTDTMLKGGAQSQINTKTMCITAMKEYQNKSIEELRLEDYIAGRKVGTQGTSLFGQQQTTPATGGGLFQKDAQPAGGGMFGGLSAFASKPTATTQASTGFFGQKPSIFGNTTTPAVSSSGSGIFGAQTQTQPNKSSLFQTPATQAGGGFFGGGGTQTGGTSIFSQTTQQSAQQPATGAFGGFGTTAQTPAFGGFKPTTTQPSIFNSGTTGGAFGQTVAPSTGTGLFAGGTSAAQPASIFGQTTNQPAAPSIFGQQSAAGGTSLFQNTNQQASTLPTLGGGAFGGGLGGGLFQQPAANNAAAVGAVPQLTTAVSLSSRARQDIIEAQLAALPYGDSPLLKPSTKSSADSPNASSPKDAAVARRSFPRFLAATSTTSASSSPIMSTSQQSTVSTLSRPKPPASAGNTTFDTSSLMNSSFSYKPIISLPSAGFGTALGVSSSFSNSPNGTALKQRSYLVPEEDKSGAGGGNLTIGSNASSRSLASRKIKALDVSVVQREGLNNSVLGSSFTDNSSTHQPSPVSRSAAVVTPTINSEETRRSEPARQQQQPLVTPAARLSAAEREPVRRSLEERGRHVADVQTNGNQSADAAPIARRQSPVRSPLAQPTPTPAISSPTTNATAGELICLPSVGELSSRVTRDGKYSVDEDGLTIARAGLGAVHWPGPFTLSRLDFEKIVTFRPREITVYTDDVNKPPVGEDLNRPAEVTLEQIWPLDKNKKPITKQKELIRLHFRERLIGVCQRMSAEFVDYNSEQGMWTFKVSHFSKYGYLDDDYDNETILAKVARLDEDDEYEAGKYHITQDELDGVDDPLDFSRFNARSARKTERNHLESRPPVFQFAGLSKAIVQKSKLNSMTTFPFRRSCRVSFGDSLTLIATAEQGGHSTVIRPIRVMPAVCLEEVLQSFLSMRHRLNEFEELKRTDLLRMYPPSQFLQLIDSFILQLKHSADPAIDEKLLTFCESVILPPSTGREIEQRVRFGDWLRRMLADGLSESLTTSVGPFCRIYKLLLHGAVQKAIKCAVEAELYDLAMLLSMYVRPPGALVQGQVLQQLKFYTANGGGKTGEPVFYGRILQLLSNSWKPSKDDEPAGLSWMHRLGVIIWYSAEPSTTLAKCVELFALDRR